MGIAIEPEPPEQEREAIVAALAAGAAAEDLGGWSQAALAEGVEEAELEP